MQGVGFWFDAIKRVKIFWKFLLKNYAYGKITISIIFVYHS